MAGPYNPYVLFKDGLDASTGDLYVESKYPPNWLPLGFAQSACGVACSQELHLLHCAYSRIAMVVLPWRLQILS